MPLTRCRHLNPPLRSMCERFFSSRERGVSVTTVTFFFFFFFPELYDLFLFCAVQLGVKRCIPNSLS